MGKSTISMAMFNSYVKLPEGNGRVITGCRYWWCKTHNLSELRKATGQLHLALVLMMTSVITWCPNTNLGPGIWWCGPILTTTGTPRTLSPNMVGEVWSILICIIYMYCSYKPIIWSLAYQNILEETAPTLTRYYSATATWKLDSQWEDLEVVNCVNSAWKHPGLPLICFLVFYEAHVVGTALYRFYKVDWNKRSLIVLFPHIHRKRGV